MVSNIKGTGHSNIAHSALDPPGKKRGRHGAVYISHIAPAAEREPIIKETTAWVAETGRLYPEGKRSYVIDTLREGRNHLAGKVVDTYGGLEGQGITRPALAEPSRVGRAPSGGKTVAEVFFQGIGNLINNFSIWLNQPPVSEPAGTRFSLEESVLPASMKRKISTEQNIAMRDLADLKARVRAALSESRSPLVESAFSTPKRADLFREVIENPGIKRLISTMGERLIAASRQAATGRRISPTFSYVTPKVYSANLRLLLALASEGILVSGGKTPTGNHTYDVDTGYGNTAFCKLVYLMANKRL